MNPEPEQRLSREQQLVLLKLAREVLHHAVTHGRQPASDFQPYPAWMAKPAACFVTLHHHDRLRGCIGSIEAHTSLGNDLIHNAYAAAFRDPRFPELSADELPDLQISISILTAPEPFPVASERDLLQRLSPGRDGLILEEGFRRGLFLPAVWDQLPTPKEFLRQLKRKAGFAVDYWSDRIKVSRFFAYEFGEGDD